MVYVFLAEGFEEIEALTPVDLLRRAGVEVSTVSIVENRRTKLRYPLFRRASPAMCQRTTCISIHLPEARHGT